MFIAGIKGDISMKFIMKSQKDLSTVCFCGTNGSDGACSDRTKK